MCANKGLRARCARARELSVRSRELSVRSRVYANRVRQRVYVCTLRTYFPSVVLSYLILH